MTYKEKYEMALETVQEILDSGSDSIRMSRLRLIMQSVFPELKESEDERIRKSLIEYFGEQCDMSDWNGVYGYQVLAWLKKQGNTAKEITCTQEVETGNGNIKALVTQKSPAESLGISPEKYEEIVNECIYGESTDKIKPRFKVGDFIANDYCFGKVIEITDDAYLLDTGQGIPFSCEHNAHLWTIQEAMNGDVLVDVYENIGIYQQHNDFDWTSYCSLGFHGGFQNFKVEHENDKTHPATKEQRDQLEKAMAEAGYTFDFGKKELKKIKQELSNSAKVGMGEESKWSDEDEELLQHCCGAVTAADYYTMEDKEEMTNWLVSLKQRIGG